MNTCVAMIDRPIVYSLPDFHLTVNFRPLTSAFLAQLYLMLENQQAWKEPPTPHGSHRVPPEQECAIATVQHRFATRKIET